MKILATTVASALIASQAFGGSYEVRCETKRVPYQATVKGGQPEKVIGGALILFLLTSVLKASINATYPPVMEATRVPPSA